MAAQASNGDIAVDSSQWTAAVLIFFKFPHQAAGESQGYDARKSRPSASPSLVSKLTHAHVIGCNPIIVRARVLGEIAVPETCARHELSTAGFILRSLKFERRKRRAT